MVFTVGHGVKKSFCKRQLSFQMSLPPGVYLILSCFLDFFLLLEIIMCYFHGICKSHLDGKEVSLDGCVKYFVFVFKGHPGEN